MKQVCITTRRQWRQWLVENHDREKPGIWLVFRKKPSGKPTLNYEESVEEALCFGWIDSLIKKINEEKYCRKFTPRKDRSVWSETNKRRVAKVIAEGRMTPFGLAKIEAAKRLGRWDLKPRPAPPLDLPLAAQELSLAMANSGQAKDGFETLAPSCQKRYWSWIATAKRPETRTKRIQETVALLVRGQKFGLK